MSYEDQNYTDYVSLQFSYLHLREDSKTTLQLVDPGGAETTRVSITNEQLYAIEKILTGVDATRTKMVGDNAMTYAEFKSTYGRKLTQRFMASGVTGHPPRRSQLALELSELREKYPQHYEDYRRGKRS